MTRFSDGDAPALFCYTANCATGLQVSLAMPPLFTSLLFLLRTDEVAAKGSAPTLVAGYLGGSTPLRQVQALVAGLYLPRPHPSSAPDWPEQLRHDWATARQGFCAALAEAAAAAEGQTKLWVPETGEGDASDAARQRGLVQRLEVALLRWAAQIGALLARHRTRELCVASAAEGPAEEVEFWRHRTADLRGLQAQLDAAPLRAVVRALEVARSPHLAPFRALCSRIAAEAEEADSNLSFLSALEAPCAVLAAATPEQVAGALPALLDALRLVWTLSPFYNTADHMAGLLHRVGVAVVAACRAALDLPGILGGQDPAAAAQRLQQCCEAAAAWRAAFAEAVARVDAALPSRPWGTLDAAAIFAHVDAFVQRCRDLQEVCAAQRQFAPAPQLATVLGGPKAGEVYRAMSDVWRAFAEQTAR